MSLYFRFSLIINQVFFLLCSILGGVLLILGLYSVLWGKSREQKANAESCLPAEKETAELKEIVTKNIV